MGDKILEEVKKIIEKDDLSAISKLNNAYAVTGSIKLENIELVKLLLKKYYV
jgi:hypothetical protein